MWQYADGALHRGALLLGALALVAGCVNYQANRPDVAERVQTMLSENEYTLALQTIELVSPSHPDYKRLTGWRETIEKNALKIVEYLLGSEDIAGSPQDNPKGRQWYQARIYPLKDHNSAINSAIWFPINITQRKYLEDQVTDLSVTDRLTGAFNRKYFLQIFENEFAISKRYNNKLSILHIAIDKLQTINDTYGQAGGDAVLKRFTTLCKATLRDSDLFARFGGAGFIVMLPGTPSLGAAIIAERIRAIAEDIQITHEEETIQFAISIGISQMLESDKNSSAVLTRADSAIYQAKIKGRNRIEIL